MPKARYDALATRTKVTLSSAREGDAAPSRASLYWVAGAILAVTILGRLPFDGLWAERLTDAAHGPAFFLLTLVMFALLRRWPPRGVAQGRIWILAPAAAIVLGILVELVQFVIGRDVSFKDVLNDALGVATAVGVVMALRQPNGHQHPGARWAGVVVAVLGGVAMLFPVVLTGAAYFHRWHSFPVLADLGSPVGTYFLAPSPNFEVERSALPADLVRTDEPHRGIHARLTDHSYWQLVLREPAGDWRGYDRLNIDVANPTAEPLAFVLKLYDESAGDSLARPGFRKVLEIVPHSRDVASIPLQDAAIDRDGSGVRLARMHRIVLARAPASGAREFYVVRLWLD